MRRGQHAVALLRRPRFRSMGLILSNPEAQAFVGRMAMPPSDAFKAAYDVFFGRLKSGRLNGSNLLTAFDVFYVRAAPSAQAALLNLASVSWTATLSANPPAFHPGYGFTSNGIDSYVEWGGWRPVDGVQYTRNSASFGFWSRRPESQGGTLAQAGAITGSPFVAARISATQASYRINDATSTAVSGVTIGAGLSIAVRPDAATKRLFRDGAQLGVDATVASTAPTSAVVREGHAFATFAQDQLPFAFAGRALTAAEVADLYDAMSEYLTAIGWQPLIVWPAGEANIRAAAMTLPAYTNRASLPDAVPAIVAGKGFTCTGACRDPRDGTWWVSAFGRNVQGDGSSTFQPHVVHLAADRATSLGVIDLVALGLPATGLQGIAFDTSDATLWIALGGTTHHIAASTASPALLAPAAGLTAAGMNGLAYDSVRHKLVYGTASVAYINKDGTTTGRPSLPGAIPGSFGDQITYCADLDAFLVTGGPNGTDGLITRVGYDQSYGALRASAVFVAPGNSAIEGLARDPVTKIATVFNDWWYHGAGSSALANGSVEVQLPI